MFREAIDDINVGTAEMKVSAFGTLCGRETDMQEISPSPEFPLLSCSCVQDSKEVIVRIDLPYAHQPWSTLYDLFLNIKMFDHHIRCL